jgi:hypothetical protein
MKIFITALLLSILSTVTGDFDQEHRELEPVRICQDGKVRIVNVNYAYGQEIHGHPVITPILGASDLSAEAAEIDSIQVCNNQYVCDDCCVLVARGTHDSVESLAYIAYAEFECGQEQI